MDPGEKVPRSPPRFADGQEEYFFAAIAKSAPPAISFLISRHLVLDLTKMCDALAVTLASQVVDAMQSVTRAISLNMFVDRWSRSKWKTEFSGGDWSGTDRMTIQR